MADSRRTQRRRGSRPAPRAGGRPPRPRSSVDPARFAAYDVLTAVRADDAYTNLVLPQILRHYHLVGRDAAFATELVSGTLRRRGSYDAILAACLDRPLVNVEAAVVDALRLGAHQLLSMRVPAHAAINTTVDLVRTRIGHGPVGFTNAVLRRVAEAELTTWVRRVAPDPAADPVGYDAVAFSHPAWVVEHLAAALAACGESDRAALGRLLAADNEPPLVTLVARPGRSEVGELPGARTAFSPYGVVLESGDPAEVAAVAEGRAGVQDEGSQLVALALASAALDGPDTRWLDLCAGPGGKAALLAGLATGRGARLLAADKQPHRVELVRRALGGDRLVPGVLDVLVADGTRPTWALGSFDRVLVDAPCSGLGALRRRPEARWRRTPTDLDTLVPLQRALLGAAVDSVRPGGIVAYATCSPVLAETRGVIESVLGIRSDTYVEPIGGLVAEIADAAGPLPGTVQLWPHRHGTDAMFVALLRRTEGAAS
ncbi:MAG: RsmB/NOP family class I SAM-dependent RNA methyltransferase [Nocardioides sp.]